MINPLRLVALVIVWAVTLKNRERRTKTERRTPVWLFGSSLANAAPEGVRRSRDQEWSGGDANTLIVETMIKVRPVC